MAGSDFPRFFDLPREIRDHILSYLVPTHETLHLHSPASHPPLNLLLAHPFIYESVTHLFFTTNTFITDHYGTRILSTLPTPTLRRIRRLSVSVVFRERPLKAEILLLSDAVLNGALRILSISIPPHHPPPSPRSRSALLAPQARLWQQLPEGMCRDLVHLLADPYLERAALWVGFHHRAGWCRFHPGVDCPHTVGGKGPDGVFRGPIKIDLELLAERYGDEERLKMMVARTRE